MGQKSKDTLAVRPQSRSGRSPSRSPKPKNRKPIVVAAPKSYASEGVKNNDIFKLPSLDYKLVVLVTMVAAAVRLFRIYQPTSVVFDEVQYVPRQSCVSI
jgi:dolichyl-phosphate-mannose-protein mannosyltransferase